MNRSSRVAFNFFDSASLRVQAPRSTVDFLRSEWGRFEFDGTNPDPDIDALWVSWPETAKPLSAVRGTTVLDGWYKGCFWKATVQETDGRLNVSYWTMPRSRLLFKDSCLEPFLLRRLQSNGLFALHASSFLIGDHGWVVGGPPGSGKTMLALTAANQGNDLLSDDVSILGKGRIYQYAVPPRIYLHHFRNREVYHDLIKPWIAPDFARNAILTLATLGRVRIPTHLRIGRESAAHHTEHGFPIGGVFCLKRTSGTPAIRAYREEESLLRDVFRSSPVHGASLVAQMEKRTRVQARTSEIVSDLRKLVRAGKCFEVGLGTRLSLAAWKAAYSNMVAAAEGLV